MSTGDKIMCGIAGLVVLAVVVVTLDVACMMALDMRLTEIPKRAAIAVGLLSSSSGPTAPAPAKATPTLKPVEASPTPKPKSPTPKPVLATPTPIPPSPVPLPTATPKPKPPTSTPIPTKTPTPKYKAPVVLLEIDGTGEVVSNNYRLPRCWKAVLYWSVEANDYGSASLIVHLHNVQDATQQILVNEFAMDVRNISESVFVPLKGGEYYLSTENTDEVWSLRMECQDEIAPSSVGLNLQGAGNMVTGNHELHQCQKSVFVWGVEPDSYGTASLIMYLCGADDCVNLVNEFGMDLSEALTGEALQALSGGNYFLVIENTSGQPWGVRWECRD